MFELRNFKYFFMILFMFSANEATIVKKDLTDANACKLPPGCRIDAFHVIDDKYAREFVSTHDTIGYICDVKNITDRFDGFDVKLANSFSKNSCFKKKNVTPSFDLRYPRDLKTKLSEKLNLKGILAFLNHFDTKFSLHITNVGGFNVELNI